MKRKLSILVVLALFFNCMTAFEICAADGEADKHDIAIIYESAENKVVISSDHAAANMRLYVAAYKDNEVVGFVSQNIDLIIGENIFEIGSLLVSKESDYAKIFLWDSNMKPYAAKKITISPTVAVSDVSANAADETVKVDISIFNNPGISSLRINVEYDETLKLIDIEFNSVFGMYAAADEPFANPQTISLISPIGNIKDNGVLATLTFDISGVPVDMEKADIFISYEQEDTFNTDFEEVIFETDSGRITFGENSRLTGKTWLVLGDSISDSTNSYATKRYFDYIAERHQMTIYNYAASGSGYSRRSLRKDLIEQFGSDSFICHRAQHAAADGVMPDYVTIFAGTNDYTLVTDKQMSQGGKWLGNIAYSIEGDESAKPEEVTSKLQTLAYYINLAVTTVKTQWPMAKILVITPSPRCDTVIIDEVEQSLTTHTKNYRGWTMLEESNLIIDICNYYSIAACDLTKNSGINLPEEKNLFMAADGLHLNDAAHEFIWRKIEKEMEKIY